MTLNDLCISSRTAISGGVQWFADIICHLRDDLAVHNPTQALPQTGDIRTWVAESYYPGLLELTWEEAVLSLLSRMQHCGSRLHPARSTLLKSPWPNCAAPLEIHKSGNVRWRAEVHREKLAR